MVVLNDAHLPPFLVIGSPLASSAGLGGETSSCPLGARRDTGPRVYIHTLTRCDPLAPTCCGRAPTLCGSRDEYPHVIVPRTSCQVVQSSTAVRLLCFCLLPLPYFYMLAVSALVRDLFHLRNF